MKKTYFYFLFFFLAFKIQAQTQVWSLVWSDEFTATAIDPANWNFETGGGGWGNNELENYTSRPDNAIIENGYLNIIAKKETYGGSNYTSARMTTKTKRNLTYGRVEARIKIPAQKGIWPAFWMLGENISSVGWPQCGEIDILEHVNKDADIHGTIHWDNNGHAQYGGSTPCNVLDYHVYSIEWDSATIKWFLDGTEYFNANILNNINSTNEFHNSFFVILNVAVGGTWPGNPDGTSVFPDTMSVDYVRFYQLRSIPPTPVITTSGSLTLCQGDSITLTCSSANSYLWSTAETTQSIIIKTSGSYTVSIDGGAAVSDSIVVTVNPLPTVGIMVDPAVATVCEGGSVTLTGTGATTYIWSGGITNAASFVPATLGVTTYTVTGTSNSCTNTATQSIIVNACTGGVGLQEISTIQEIKIYPNPNSGLFKIETKNAMFSRIKITNLWGEIIYESTDQRLEFDLSSQSKGTYFVEVFMQDTTVHKKLIIQ